MKDLGITVNWYGPYSNLSTAGIAARRDFADGLYLAISGQTSKYKPEQTSIIYIGASGDLGRRVTPSHGTLMHSKVGAIWLGEISSHIPSGKRSKIWNAGLDTAEACLIYFLSPGLNVKRKGALPDRSFVLVNRWYKVDYETETNRPHPRCPEIIDYYYWDGRTTLVWTGEDARVEQQRL